MADLKYAYVLQQELQPTVQQVKSGQLPIPNTAFIPSADWLRIFAWDHLTDPTVMRENRIELPKDVVVEWGLGTGDLLAINGNGKIISVNGLTDPRKVLDRPKIEGVGALRADYAKRALRIDKFGIHSIRAATLLSPIGYGQRLGIVSPPDTGKTWLIRDVLRGLLNVSRSNPKMKILILHVGERAEDGTGFYSILREVEHDREQVELYTTPDGDREAAHYWVARFVLERAKQLTRSGFDVVVLMDSASRILMSHSRSDEIIKPANAGMISGGISTASVSATKRLLATAGHFECGTLTIISTMLGAESGKPSHEAALAEEVGPSVMTAWWELIKIQKSGWPKLNVANTRTRQIEDFASPAFLQEMQQVNRLMWRNTAESEEEEEEDSGGSEEDVTQSEEDAGKRQRRRSRKRPARAEDALKALLVWSATHPVPAE